MTQRSHRLGVALAGAGHSGSTLLGLVLGSHSRCFYAGEAKKSRFLGDPAKPLRKRACKLCGEACPVWGSFARTSARQGDVARTSARQGDVAPEPDLCEALARLTGREVIVDSTKDTSWIRSQRDLLDAAGVAHKLVFLVRDGRAVVNSRLRKDPSREPAAVVDAWARQVRATQALALERPDDTILVRYEELATEPERVVRRVCEHIGIAFEHDMLRYERAPHHPLGGNTGTQSLVARPAGTDRAVPDRSRAFYEPLRGGFHLDLRWRDELAPAALAVFEARAGDLNEPYRWERER